LGQQAPSNGVPLHDNLGAHQRGITTTSPLAQRYFNQGLQLANAFGRTEAVQSFREAQRHDPECAMCFWGEAWALGPYINEAMGDEAGREAYRAIQKANALAPNVTENERDLIEAMAMRYAPAPTADNRARLDSAYADAMRDVVRRFPNDLDAGALLGEAIMVLSPWDHWAPDGQPRPGTDEAIAVLESVLARDIKNPGACHHYIHLVEASPNPERAEACADHLAAAIPGASHIQHMPSHIYMNIGRYGDSVRANQRAWQVDQQAAHGAGFAIYPGHNLHMLIFAAWQDGQSAVALQAAEDLAMMSPDDAFYPLLMRVRFGRWDEVLAMEAPESDFHRGMWHFSQGMAHLRMAHPDSARFHLDRLEGIAAATPDSRLYGFVGHRQKDLLNIAAVILGGESAASEGRFDDAVGTLTAALALEDHLVYDEPEPWPLPVRHYLGAVLHEANRQAEAERVFREALEDHPGNGWSLHGLKQSLVAQGKDDEAAEVLARFEEAWARADVWLPSSRF